MAHPLRDRNFRLLFTGRVVDELGNWVSPAALTLAIVIATHSSAGLAVVLVCALLPKVALLPIGGGGAGRPLAPPPPPGRRLAPPTPAHCPHPTPSAPTSDGPPALRGRAPSNPPPTSPPAAAPPSAAARPAATALMGTARRATSLAGPALAGVVIFTVGAGWAFVLDAATLGFSA